MTPKEYSDLSRSVLTALDRSQLKRICDGLKAENPQRWETFQPRRVVSPPEYIRHEFQAMAALVSTDSLRRSIANFLDGGTPPPGTKMEMTGGGDLPKRFKVGFDVNTAGKGHVPFARQGETVHSPTSPAVASARASNLMMGNGYKWPTYYLSAELATALLMTEPPADLRLDQLKWPLDFFSLFLPLTPEVQKLTCGRRVPFIWVSRLVQAASDEEVQLVTEPNLSVSFVCFEELEPGKGEIMVDYGAVLSLSRQVSSIHTVNHDFALGDPSGDSEKFISKMVYLAVSAAMAMTSRPALVEAEACTRPEKRHAKTGKLEREALWSPNFIGRNYRRAPLGGTHASPRAHWRCGHWTKQHYGPRPWTPETPWKIEWREPVLVNAE